MGVKVVRPQSAKRDESRAIDFEKKRHCDRVEKSLPGKEVPVQSKKNTDEK